MEWSSAVLARGITQNSEHMGIDSVKQQQSTREKEREKRDLDPREQNGTGRVWKVPGPPDLSR